MTDGEAVVSNERTMTKNLEEGELYESLGGLKQEEQQSLHCAPKSHLRRMSLIRTSPLSDYNRIIASNTYALPVLA